MRIAKGTGACHKPLSRVVTWRLQSTLIVHIRKDRNSRSGCAQPASLLATVLAEFLKDRLSFFVHYSSCRHLVLQFKTAFSGL